MRTAVLALCGLAACDRSQDPQPPPYDGTIHVPELPATVVEDRFLQYRDTQVDVLFVVQAAGADMVDLQDGLAARFPTYLDALVGSGLDWHVGVVTTDLADDSRSGRLVGDPRWLDAETPDPIDAFAQRVDLGGAESPDVQPTGAVYRALELQRDLYNAGFYREDAALHVVLAGDGTDVTEPLDLDSSGFLPWFDGLKTGHPSQSLSCLLAAGATGHDCSDTVAGFGVGSVVAIDDPDPLEQLAWHATTGRAEFVLTRPPADGSIEVTVVTPDGTELPPFSEAEPDEDGQLVGEWTYDPAANSVRLLRYLPGPDDTLVVTYVDAGA